MKFSEDEVISEMIKEVFKKSNGTIYSMTQKELEDVDKGITHKIYRKEDSNITNDYKRFLLLRYNNLEKDLSKINLYRYKYKSSGNYLHDQINTT